MKEHLVDVTHCIRVNVMAKVSAILSLVMIVLVLALGVLMTPNNAHDPTFVAPLVGALVLSAVFIVVFTKATYQTHRGLQFARISVSHGKRNELKSAWRRSSGCFAQGVRLGMREGQ